MHIALPIGKSSILMGSDTPEFMGKHNENENRSKISISAESKEEADQLFNGLSAGGKIEMSLDGFVSGLNGEMDWIKVNEGIFDYVGKRISDGDTALYGRVTYQMMENYWPILAIC